MTEEIPKRSKVSVRINASSEEVALEVGYALLGRALDLHYKPDDDHKDIALELEDLGNEIVEKYEPRVSDTGGP